MGRKIIFYLIIMLFLFNFNLSNLLLLASPIDNPLEYSSDYKKWTTADHSKIPHLQQNFNSPEEVTKACIYCHTKAAKQIHKTIHWTWKCSADHTGKMGKDGLTLNNF